MRSSIHHITKLIGIILIAVVLLSACESESLTINLRNLSYDKESRALSADFSTNIPPGTVVEVAIHTPNGDLFYALETVVIENETTVEFHIDDEMIRGLEDGLYFLEVIIEVNESMDFYNHKLGGNQIEVSRRYENSEDVSVSKLIDSVNGSYNLYIKSNKLNFATGLTDEERKVALKTLEVEKAVEETEEVETEVEEAAAESEFSLSFEEYNNKYYNSFSNELTLIGSNFEILGMDGYGNQNIVDDLIRWTNEFNELLNVYEANAVPINEKDKKFHAQTIQMIEYQREANRYILTALTEKDDLSLLIAEEYLNTTADMYLEGYELLN